MEPRISQPKISDYGTIGNCRTSALVSNRGSIEWCCLPKFDSEAFFSSILGSRGGFFSIEPLGDSISEQRYIGDTNILETTFKAGDSVIRISDCFTVTSEREKRRRLQADTEILRSVECLRGVETVRVRFRPKAEFGEKAIPLRRLGSWGILAEYGRKVLILQGSFGNSAFVLSEAGEARAVYRLKAGEKLLFSLSYSDEAPAVTPCLGEHALERFEETRRYWLEWIRRCNYSGPYVGEVRRSALALKLLTYAPSGAIIAAPTTSLPEAPGYGRNWDYRYCWLRDASFTVRALVSLGFVEEAVAYVSWLLHATALTHPRLQVVYSVFGESKLKERRIDFLEGYLGSRPVRIGNAASGQIQLDVYGEVLDGLCGVLPYLGHVDAETRGFVLEACKVICQEWNTPDQGIWEMRSSPRHFTHSKVMAWVALDRTVEIAEKYRWKFPREQYLSSMEKIRRSIEANAFREDIQSYTQSFASAALDASVLVMPLVNYCKATDSRMLSTLAAIKKHLSKNGLIFRYRSEHDGLEGKEGAFGICNFWMAEALMRAGRLREGKSWMEAMLARKNSLALWSEEIDPDTNQFLGNYPQGFTHIGFINAATTLAVAEKERKIA